MIAFISSEEYQKHTNDLRGSVPSHPESPARLMAIEQRLKTGGLWEDLDHRAPVDATIEQLAAVHDPAYVAELERVCANGAARLDEDTSVVPESYRVARLAAGGACLAVDLVLSGEKRAAFCAVRPPGHHAERDHAMGFCLFNNVAVAAEHARRAHGIERVAIIDWDVHHGNGTQHLFESDPGVFYLSLHQYPLYPGTGAARERGKGEGDGATLNAPMAAGTGDREWIATLEGDFTRAVEDFKPELVIVSAGFDAHRDDPLAQTLVTEDGFKRMTEIVKTWAPGRVVSVLEGGYDLQALGRSVETHLAALGE